jgi:formylglycine-generating enzyme required for sulfatase activity
LSRDYFIYDAQGERRIGEMELPLHIGGKDRGGIVLPGVSEDLLAGYLAISDGHVYLQPADDGPAIFLNDERIRNSTWLKSGDSIQIDDTLIRWVVKGDKVLIEVTQQPGQPLHPPIRPPPDEPPPTDNDMPVRAHPKAPIRPVKIIRTYIFSIVGLLLLAAVFLLVATPVIILIEPQVQTLNMKGFPPPLHLWGSRLALPGQYTIEAYLPGYAPLNEQVNIRMDGTTTLNFTLDELPGLLQITSIPDIALKLLVDNVEPSLDKTGAAKIGRGIHQLQILANRYLPHEQNIEIKGYGNSQQLNIELQPAWANISISSQPEAAKVLLDGEFIGQTPLNAEILQGQHELQISLGGFKPVSLTQTVEAGKDKTLEPVSLQPVDGTLSISSQPGGASITLDQVFRGMAPLDLPVTANREHLLRLSKSGYATLEQSVTLKPDETRALNIELKAEYGTIFLETYPADARLRIDGKVSDKKNGRIRLSVRPHIFELSKPGYVTRTLTLTPQQGVSQNVKIKLETRQQQLAQKKIASTPASITSPVGQSLKLIKPDSSFTMGASRREAGRRANESRRLVELKRSFYFATKEVTNREYRLFQASHTSGSLDGAGLNGEEQPAVNISWDDAARYCNWLSDQQGLPPAYAENEGKMVAVQPMNTGYRLPTEAEWAWVARRHEQLAVQRYPWKGSYPPVKVDGNYADARIADTLADVIPNYDDNYRGTASVGSFPAWPSGFYDLGGNASEWVHDYYALYPGEATQLVTDPTGPSSATHHVVRGASWRHGNITELRLSYRDYSNKPRYDLGFRIARYAE